MKQKQGMLVSGALLAGCVEEDVQTDEDSEQDIGADAEEEEENINEEADVGEDVTAEADENIEFSGGIEIDGNDMTVTGETNLMPGAEIEGEVRMDDVASFGTDDSFEIEEDGAFELEHTIPDYDRTTHYRLVFNPYNQENQDVIDFYGGEGENIEGDFLRLDEEYDEEDVSIQVASFEHILPPDFDEQQSISIEAPNWDLPEDQGETDIRLDVKTSEEDNHYCISGGSNLVEGARVHGYLRIPGYQAIGYSGQVHANPDGSFELRVNIPDDLDDYEEDPYLVVTMNPNQSNQWEHIAEYYGEEGEDLEGELAEEGSVELEIPLDD
ncbi:hypothetical protein [Salicibibacter kimchii]|uniref:Uncharacterized protein n=1 Tax=Salicibibacter kimchii TaxID=2099786 RepID=A0A345BZ56_9BACI|nr:hypothetical protein [Salicibibacter kimchii]AXF56237.1 hypothetical protein DT065_09560 [Salicibibacter kimchii]